MYLAKPGEPKSNVVNKICSNCLTNETSRWSSDSEVLKVFVGFHFFCFSFTFDHHNLLICTPYSLYAVIVKSNQKKERKLSQSRTRRQSQF